MKTFVSFWEELCIRILVMIAAYILGWLFGVVLALTPIGAGVLEGLSLLLETATFARSSLGVIMGTFCFFAAFFFRRD